MKCKVCKRRAVINLRAQNRGLCESCFDAYVLDRVELTIKRYKMFSRGQRILVAVSGGKDSLGLWDILARLGYEPAGLFVDCLLYTSPSPRDLSTSRMPSSA